MMQAVQLPKGSMDRLLLITAFAQSGFATGLRPFRNLNAAMGETLEVSNMTTHAQRRFSSYTACLLNHRICIGISNLKPFS